jgi:hypothetical protein
MRRKATATAAATKATATATATKATAAKATAKTRLRPRRGGGGKTRRNMGRHNAPRIVILDNDETTGSYWILFKFVHLFRDNHLETFDVRAFIPAITSFCLKARLFRPGLPELLKTLHTLRASGKLDALVMYTYQDEIVGRKDDWREMYNTHGMMVNIPTILDYCFGYIASNMHEVRTFFDVRIARPGHRQLLGLAEDDSLGAKQMSAVFKALKSKPTNNLQNVAFIDDCYLNTVPTKPYKFGPFTGTFIKPYNMTINDISIAIRELQLSYKKFFHTYVSAPIFDQLIDKIKSYELDKYSISSDCRSQDPYSYDQIDLTGLATRLRKFYS